MAKKGARRAQARANTRQSQSKKADSAPKSSAAGTADGDGGSSGGALRINGVRGLMNLGNTCFLNSITQCLNVSAPFSDELIGISKEGLGGIGTSLCSVFKGIRGQETTSSKSKNGNAISPKPLLTHLVSRFPWYRGGDQQDAHEFLRMLLGSLSDETTMSERKAAKAEKEEVSRQPGMPSGQCERTIWNNFRGHLGSAVLCWKCQRVSLSLDPFLDLSLTMPSHAQPAGILGTSVSEVHDAGDGGTGGSADADAAAADAEESDEQDGERCSKKEKKRRRKEKGKQRADAATAAPASSAAPDEKSNAPEGGPRPQSVEASPTAALETSGVRRRIRAALDEALASQSASFAIQQVQLTQQEKHVEATAGASDAKAPASSEHGADEREKVEASVPSEDGAEANDVSTQVDATEEAPGNAAISPDGTDVPVDAAGSNSERAADASSSAADGREGASAGADGDADAAGEEGAPSSGFEVQLSRDGKGADARWGFQWHLEKLAEGILAVQGVVEDSLVDRWNLKRRSLGDEERVICPGDYLMAVNGYDKREKMQKALKEESAVTLLFSHQGKETVAATSTSNVSAGSGRAAAKKKKEKAKAPAEDEVDEKEAEAERAKAREARRLDFRNDAMRCHESLPEAIQAAFTAEKFEGMAKFELADCMRLLSNVEALQEDFAPTYQCEECLKGSSNRTFASRRVWLWPPLPRLLTVHLNRFRRRGASARFDKSSDRVSTAACLDFSDFLLTETQYNCFAPHLSSGSVRQPPPAVDAAECRYELYGVCVHQGASMQSGHYVAYVNAGPSLEDEEWYGASDTNVWKCTRAQVLEVEAYVAFYRREGILKSPEKPQDEDEDDGDVEAEDDAAQSAQED